MSETQAGEIVTDATGRKFKIRVLDPADLLDLSEAAGAQSGNTGYMRLAMIVCSVAEIDDVPMPLPAKKQHIHAMARKVGNVGITALSKALFGDDSDEEAVAAKEAEGVEIAKN